MAAAAYARCNSPGHAQSGGRQPTALGGARRQEGSGRRRQEKSDDGQAEAITTADRLPLSRNRQLGRDLRHQVKACQQDAECCSLSNEGSYSAEVDGAYQAEEQHDDDRKDGGHSMLHNRPAKPVHLPAQPGRHAHTAEQRNPQTVSDFSRRDMGRLGGEGVASLLGGSGGTGAGGWPAGGPKRASGDSCAAALSDIRAGPSDNQRARQAAQREQLRRDLEEQMRAKREAEAAQKAQLAALEEREEAQLRAYWAAQARSAEGEAASRATRDGPSQQTQQRQRQEDAGVAPPPALAATRNKGTLWEQAAGARSGVGEALGAAAGGARRGEALLQPGIAVFLPPDKEAERQASIRARDAAHAPPAEAAAAAPTPRSAGVRPPGTAPAAAALVAAQQALPLISPAQAAALIAAASPAYAQAWGGGLPLYPYHHPAMLPYLVPPATAPEGPPAAPPSPSTDPRLLALLQEVQQEQRRLREQLTTHLGAAARLGGDAAAARSERDRARLDLERVQRLLAEGQGTQGWEGLGGEQGLLAVTTHVLPLGAHSIPSRLGTPAVEGGAGRAQHGGQAAGPHHLPARYRQQAEEPWQRQAAPPPRGAAAGRATQAAGSGASHGRAGRAKAAAGTSKAAAVPKSKGWRA